MAVTAKGMPESWPKPVVNSVLLPAHGETTGKIGEFSCNFTTGARPVRICLLSDAGDYYVVIVGSGFSPDPGNGVPFTATLFINGKVVDTGSGVTEDEGGGRGDIRIPEVQGKCPRCNVWGRGVFHYDSGRIWNMQQIEPAQ